MKMVNFSNKQASAALSTKPTRSSKQNIRSLENCWQRVHTRAFRKAVAHRMEMTRSAIYKNSYGSGQFASSSAAFQALPIGTTWKLCVGNTVGGALFILQYGQKGAQARFRNG